MFDEKVKIDFKKKYTVKRKVSGVEIKVSPYLNSDQITMIVNRCVNHFTELFNNDNLITAVASSVAQMEMLVCLYATDVNLENAEYDDVSASGLIQIVRECVASYDTIKTALLLAICPVCIDKLVGAMGKMASPEELEKDTKQLIEMFDKNPEKAKMFADIVKANNPVLNKVADLEESK